MVTTLVFLLVILAVTDERNEHPALAPLAIGLSLAMIHFTTIPLTGTSVNPARSIGPALFAGGDAILQLWLFILAPLLGGALAGVLYPALFGRHGEPVAVRGCASAAVRRPGRCPATARPTPTSSSGTSSTPGPGPAARPALAAQPPQEWQQPQYPTAPPPQRGRSSPPQQQPPPAAAAGQPRPRQRR